MMTQEPSEYKQDVTEQLRALWARLEHDAQHGRALHEVEQELFSSLQRMGLAMLKGFIALHGAGDEGESQTLASGVELKRMPARVSRRYVSVFGLLKFERCVYARRAGQRYESVPLDARLGLPSGEYSYLLQDWSQHLSTQMPYRQAAQTLERILGHRFSISLLERSTQALADTAAAYRQARPVSAHEQGEFIVASADGKGVPIVKHQRLRRIEGHQPNRGPEPDRKRIALLGAVWEGRAHYRTPEQVCEALFSELSLKSDVAASRPKRPEPLNKRVHAVLPKINAEGEEIAARGPLFGWLGQQLRERDPHAQKTVVVLMDGQHSLWSDARVALKGHQTVEILDLLHATSALWTIVHQFYQSGSDQALAAMQLFTHQLLNGQVRALLKKLSTLADANGLRKSKRRAFTKAWNYLHNHRNRMRYHRYLAAGYPIASGVIEGACRHVVKDRMERSGMRWVLDSAQAMLDLRCVVVNEQWDDFLQFRIARETRRLYAANDERFLSPFSATAA